MKIKNRIFVICIFSAFLALHLSAYGSNIIYSPATKETTVIQKPVEDSAIISKEEAYYNSNSNSVVGNSSEQVVGDIYIAKSIDYDNVHNILEDGGNFYCLDPDGTIVRSGWRKISKASFANYAPVEDFPYSFIWAYFLSNGRAVKASSGKMRKYQIGNYSYAFNEYGQMLTGFFNEEGEMWNESREQSPFDLMNGENDYLYYADENYGNLKTGWLKVDNTKEDIYPNKVFLWLYFNPTNFRITKSTGDNYKSLSIDGYTYAFDDLGIMLTGLEAYNYNELHGGNTSKVVYFDDEGREVKNGFVSIDYSTDDAWSDVYDDDMYEDEDIIVYMNRTGNMYRDTIKKIGNNTYYGFDDNGVVVRGLSVWNGGHFVATIDTEMTDGKEYISSGNYRDKRGNSGTITSGDTIHYFDSSGKRRNSATIEFADDRYSYEGNNNGGYDKSTNKKLYSHGILIKPPMDVKYGIFIQNPTKDSYSMKELVKTNNYVVGRTGNIITGNDIIKDNDDNYIVVQGGSLSNVYNVEIRKSGGRLQFRSTNSKGNETWFDFGEKDSRGRTCVLDVLPNGTSVSGGATSAYQGMIESDAALNFKITR